METKEKNYEWVELPSKGLCYPASSPLRKGKVKVSYLTAMDENLILNPKLYIDDSVFLKVLSQKLVDKDIDPKMLVISDVEGIILWLRRTGYGDDFSVNLKKPNSDGDTLTADIDLSTVQNRDFYLPCDDNGNFPYFVGEDDCLKFRYISYSEMLDLLKNYDETKERTEDEYIKELLKIFTVSINGETERETVEKYIDDMDEDDAYYYLDFIQQNSPGFETINVPVHHDGKDENINVVLEIDKSIFLTNN